ncbi:hypothetical protein V6N11_042272 [Hibiscus sabdariffa]|uniref:Uncharacterized protein n=1 Tax=Hibiscus sabdariffa TaxID=183260 RepID=A0ABR2QVU3_9ROSI
MISKASTKIVKALGSITYIMNLVLAMEFQTDRLFLDKSKNFKLNKSPNDLGIEPVILLLDKEKWVRSLRSATPVGISPEN